MLNFDFVNSLPGQGPTINEVAQASGLQWGPLNHLRFLPTLIDGSAADAGNTAYTSVLRPGLLLGKIKTGSDAKKYAHWNPDATDGTQKIAGVLMWAQAMTSSGSAADKFLGYVAFGGPVRAAGLQIPSLTTTGIVGATLEHLVRRQMYPYFQLDDDPAGVGAEFSNFRSVAADLTITEVMNNTVFSASAAANFTLPATAKHGLQFRFVNVADVNMTITAGTADTMIVYNDIAADSVALSTASEKVGGSFTVFGDGSKWVVIPNLWEGQTPTIAT